MNQSRSKKPIEELSDSIRELSSDIKTIRNDLAYIKSKIREKVIQEQLEEQKFKEECVIESKGWWWG